MAQVVCDGGTWRHAGRDIPPRNLEWLRRFPGHQVDAPAADTWRRALGQAQEFVSLLVERGAPILPGTDEPWGLLPPGLSLWRELALLVECGLSPLAALHSATAAAAQRLRLADRGRLLPGCAADFVVVKGDPTKTLAAVPEVVATARDGRLFQPRELRERSLEYARSLEHEPMGVAFAALAGDTGDAAAGG